MNQVALDLFETSQNPDRDPGYIALGPNAREGLGRPEGEGPGSASEDVLLGELVWYSVSDAVRLAPETLGAAIAAANLDAKRLTPHLPSPSSALSRAAEAAEARRRIPAQNPAGNGTVETELYANVLLRTASRGVKQLVTEILDAANDRLSYRSVARVSPGYKNGKPDGTVLVERRVEDGDVSDDDLLDVEVDAVANLKSFYDFERRRHDGEAARRVLGRVLSEANAVPLRNSGGMYFVPRDHSAYAKKILLFVEEVRVRAENAPTRQARASMAMKVPLVDREEYREVLAESLEFFVKKEAESLIKEMSSLLKADQAVSERRGRGFVERVRKLKENVSEYEELLQMHATEARANLDVAAREARALLGRVGP
ncbi:MAG: hypothetical protein M3R38_08385 [Actinomycetota bacterium]|jgi:hypothetical protein|nr:hypothetical protein [Actinomycetota bacterium]